MLPKLEDRHKIGYSKLSMDWARKNEHYVWTYFVEKQLLFSSENKLITRFINNAPFSKFYLSIDNESPGMIGRFIGWEIVRSYMKNNNTSFIEMILPEIIDFTGFFNIKSKIGLLTKCLMLKLILSLSIFISNILTETFSPFL